MLFKMKMKEILYKSSRPFDYTKLGIVEENKIGMVLGKNSRTLYRVFIDGKIGYVLRVVIKFI